MEAGILDAESSTQTVNSLGKETFGSGPLNLARFEDGYGMKLTDPSGKVNLNTPEMIETLEFYKKISKYSPPGSLYWLHTRMDYLSGRAAEGKGMASLTVQRVSKRFGKVQVLSDDDQ